MEAITDNYFTSGRSEPPTHERDSLSCLNVIDDYI